MVWRGRRAARVLRPARRGAGARLLCRWPWAAVITPSIASTSSVRGPTSSRCSASRSSMAPVSSTRPSCNRTRWSQTRSSSATTWDDSTTVRSLPATASRRVRKKSRRATGSRLATGSSSTSSRGCLARARVSATCACCPPDNVEARRSRAIPMPVSRSRAPVRSKGRFIERPKWSRSATVNLRYNGWSCATNPMRASFADWSSRGGSPNIRTVPSVGRSNPIARCSRVVFPAPFAPTNPTMPPCGSSRSQSRSAQVRRP